MSIYEVNAKEKRQQRLSPEVLLSAYTQGFFPMPDPASDNIDWYRPSPRAIFNIGSVHLSRSTKKFLAKNDHVTRFSYDFEAVIRACADREETWITEEFIEAYMRLHQLGFAHSVEVYQDKDLVAGVYGVCIRGAFFAESMFHKRTNMSKLALSQLDQRLQANGFKLLECQFITEHLRTLGAIAITDEQYQVRLREALASPASFI